MEVLQTSALPLGYPAACAVRDDPNAERGAVNAALGGIAIWGVPEAGRRRAVVDQIVNLPLPTRRLVFLSGTN